MTDPRVVVAFDENKNRYMANVQLFCAGWFDLPDGPVGTGNNSCEALSDLISSINVNMHWLHVAKEKAIYNPTFI